MAQTTQVQYGVKGLPIIVPFVDQDGTVVDISTATTKKVWLFDPNGTAVSKDAIFHTDGTDGLLKYVTVDGDLEVLGDWRAQGYCVVAAQDLVTKKQMLTVVSNIGDLV